MILIPSKGPGIAFLSFEVSDQVGFRSVLLRAGLVGLSNGAGLAIIAPSRATSLEWATGGYRGRE